MDTVQENSVTNTTQEIPAWRREGLPGRPALIIQGEIVRVPYDELIRDDTGRIIVAPIHDHAETLMSAHLGKTIEAITLLTQEQRVGKFPRDFLLDQVVFRYAGNGHLSYLERRAAATLAWVTTNYYPPMKRRDRMVLPTALDDLPKELQSPRLNVQMWKIFTEGKAYQVASVLEAMFSDIETTVFEDGDGWYVAINDDLKTLEDMAQLERVETVLWALSNFDVVPNEYSMGALGAGLCADGLVDAEEHLHGRAIRAFNAYTAQQRIEDGIAAILAHLGHPEAPGRENIPSAHSDPQRAAKGGKTASSKSAPVAVDVFDEGGGNGDKHRLPAPSRKSAKSSAKSK